MLKKILSCFAAAMLFVGVTAAVTAQETSNSPVGAKHVVWIGADGFGAHYVNWDQLPTMKKMKENGAWTLHMRSVIPSSSAINWETMLVGAPSESHGYRDWGSKVPDVAPIYLAENGRFPDAFYVLKQSFPKCKTSVVYDWDGIGFLYDKKALDSDVYVENGDSEKVFETAKEQLAAKPEFAFIYFGDPDRVGHGIGWGTPEYQASLTKFDEYVGKLLAYMEEIGMMEDTVVLISSDHGGSGKGHGQGILEHMEVPFLIYGKGVKAGEITDVVVNYDLAATVVWILGAKEPQAWRGLPVKSAF